MASFDISTYLVSTIGSTTPPRSTKLSGGTANLVYRLADNASTPQVVILKHAEPYIASAPNVPFPVERMDFEHRALTQLPSHLPLDKHVRMPKVYRYDADQHVLMIEDGGGRTLKDAYTDPRVDVKEYGRKLGSWLAALHDKTRVADVGNNMIAKNVYRFSYNGVADAAKAFGLDAELGMRISATYGALLTTDDDCICHGDFWPGNVLLAERGAMVVDWEMVRRGCGATDIGQFAAEAYLLDKFRGGRGLLSAFLEGYREAAGSKLEEEWLKRAAIHMGVHLAFWPSRVEWGTKEETKECILLGNEIMARADREDWEWLEEGLLKELFCLSGVS